MGLFMDLAALRVLCMEVKNGTNGHYLAVCSVHIAFALHFVATHLPQTLTSYRSVSGIGYTSEKLSKKWQAIQLAIHSIVGE